MCTQATTDSKKYDHGKLRWDLLPLNLIEKIVEIYTFGAEKYGANTWQNLPDGYDRYKAAMFRHLMEFEKGNVVDDESGKEHLAHMVWNAIAMLYVSGKQKIGKLGLTLNVGQYVAFEIKWENSIKTGVGEITEYRLTPEREFFIVREENSFGEPMYLQLDREDIKEIIK